MMTVGRSRVEAVKDHDILVYDKDGKVRDVIKADESKPLPHADGCVGCRRAGMCVRCGKAREPGGVILCTVGACDACCLLLHVRHDVAYKMITYAMPTKEALEKTWRQS